MLLRYGAPHLETLRDRAMLNAAIDAGMVRECRVDGVNWILPAAETVRGTAPDTVRLLAPFDPVVWDRRRFELFWGWRYRFEAYTPPAKRRLGYYALPLLWRDQVAGWANVKSDGARLVARSASRRPARAGGIQAELDAELERMREFLGATGSAGSPLPLTRARQLCAVGQARR
jgi:hypothetical protein